MVSSPWPRALRAPGILWGLTTTSGIAAAGTAADHRAGAASRHRLGATGPAPGRLGRPQRLQRGAGCRDRAASGPAGSRETPHGATGLAPRRGGVRRAGRSPGPSNKARRCQPRCVPHRAFTNRTRRGRVSPAPSPGCPRAPLQDQALGGHRYRGPSRAEVPLQLQRPDSGHACPCGNGQRAPRRAQGPPANRPLRRGLATALRHGLRHGLRGASGGAGRAGPGRSPRGTAEQPGGAAAWALSCRPDRAGGGRRCLARWVRVPAELPAAVEPRKAPVTCRWPHAAEEGAGRGSSGWRVGLRAGSCGWFAALQSQIPLRALESQR